MMSRMTKITTVMMIMLMRHLLIREAIEPCQVIFSDATDVLLSKQTNKCCLIFSWFEKLEKWHIRGIKEGNMKKE